MVNRRKHLKLNLLCHNLVSTYLLEVRFCWNLEIEVIMIGNCKKSCCHNCTITVSEKTTMFAKMPENLKESENLNKFCNRLTRMSDLKPLSWEY